MEETKEEKKVSEEVIAEAEEFINQLFKEKLPKRCLFHNYKHTTDVVDSIRDLTEKSDITDKDKEKLILAAWFHDSGMTENYFGHEKSGAKIAEDYLKKYNYPDADIDEIKKLIISTDLKAKPKNYLEELMHDADLSHIGKKGFFRKGELLRVETEHFTKKTYSELEWQKKQYEFLINNDFITQPAKEEYEKRRAKNIKKQRNNIHKARKVTTRKKTGKDFGRGIDTLYRATYRNHINLSAIADGKANMMISINTIILSVIVTLSGASLSLSEGFTFGSLRYIMPIFILLLGCLSSVVYAIISARPKVTQKEVDMEEVKKNNDTVLYFGNFLGIPRETFVKHLRQLKEDQQFLYDSMSMDLYNLGHVLEKKYRLLKVSYNLFMIGLVASVLTFIVTFLITNV
ncbi:MAG: Pycsar system effector family protein [Candidatus Cyclobacteriaceae bacterium M2_1C_046]